MFEVVNTKKLGKEIKKTLVAGALSAALLMGVTTPVMAGTYLNPDVYLNDEIVYYVNERPFIEAKSGVTYIPLNETLASKRGYSIYNSNGEITISSEYHTLKMKENEKVYIHNNTRYELNAPVQSINGVIYVPIEIISMALGANTELNDETYRINFVTNQNKVNESRINTLLNKVDKNRNLTYSEKSLVKEFVKKYVNLSNPTLDTTDRMERILSSVDIDNRYNGYRSDFYDIKGSVITINSSRTSTISYNDSLRNALATMFSDTTNPLLKEGMNEIISAEAMNENTNHSKEMVSICKMLSDVIGSDKLLEAYHRNDMDVIKDELMKIYNDEALYNDFIRLIKQISYESYMYRCDTYTNSETKRKVAKDFKDDALHIYDIVNTYYQCKYGSEISKDEVMQCYLIELLSHGEEKAFRVEPTMLKDAKRDYYVIYYQPQNAYNKASNAYYYDYKSRPINYKGNGQILRLK